MIRVYIAGALTASSLSYLENMRRMITVATRLFILGLSPFCPCLDYHYALNRTDLDEKFVLGQFHRASLPWLEVSKAVLVLPQYKKSRGTKGEIKRARQIGIPVFYEPDVFFLYFNLEPDPQLTVLWEQWAAEKP